ncbi:MAG: bifunctional (p)ppGpp synthetase/guanosine-3',5'-bis(diphosphate) 3'-pyrophosphohydrolase [Desulfobacterales bacterium]|nr:bifunctional (p)ppGpp synthetase/guanosine-3',5'-bis(diphosphate) 3'-pyrophosphohydrolase [Desulfobacterales bacterium]
MKIWSPDLYIKAWNFACSAHLGQKVPGTDLPYVNHIANVSMEVMTAIAYESDIDNPDLAVQSALLHDTLEDTKVCYNKIKSIFGEDVAKGVLALTKDKNLSKKADQMKDSLNRILQQPKEIWMVKLADRITNLQPPPNYWSKEKIVQYHKEAIEIFDTLRLANKILEQRLLTDVTCIDIALTFLFL